MQNRWALIDADSVVANVVIWTGGESLWPNLTPILLNENERCAPGWTYEPNSNPRFIEPPTEG